MKHLSRYPDTVVQASLLFKTVSSIPSNADYWPISFSKQLRKSTIETLRSANEILAKIFKRCQVKRVEDCMAVDLVSKRWNGVPQNIAGRIFASCPIPISTTSTGILHEHASNSNEEDRFLDASIRQISDPFSCGPNLQPCSCFSPQLTALLIGAPKNVYSLELQRDLVLDAFLREISSHGNLRYVRVECVLHLDLICEMVRSCKNLTHIGWLWHARNEVAAGLQPLFDALDEANAIRLRSVL
uniref:F-box domain-containing protein n=1 Tax=Ditylenchus dipsaci TaxID=166011 RepID=A0A915ENV6_9BILA